MDLKKKTRKKYRNEQEEIDLSIILVFGTFVIGMVVMGLVEIFGKC